MQPELPKYMTPTNDTWSTRRVHPMTRLTMSPFDICPLPHVMDATLRPMQEDSHPLALMMEYRGVGMRVEVRERYRTEAP